MLEVMTQLVEQLGAPAIGLLMLLENLFPPIPSEVIMTAAGYQASLGRMSLLAVVLWGTIGSVLGAVFWYWVGRLIGLDRLRLLAARHGRWLTLRPDEITVAEAWFHRHGKLAVFLGRLVPTVRTLISIPAGFAGMPFPAFLAFSTIGSLIWTALLALGGWILGEAFGEIDAWLDPISTSIVLAIIAVYLYRVITWPRRSPKEDPR